MSAQVRLLEELIQKYKGSTAGVDNALAEFESQAGRKATKEEFDQAMGKAPLKAGAGAGESLSPDEIIARGAERQRALPPGPGKPKQLTAGEPTSQPPAARSITDLAGQDPFASRPGKVQVEGEVRPRLLEPGKPAPAPLRELMAKSGEPLRLKSAAPEAPVGMEAPLPQAEVDQMKAGMGRGKKAAIGTGLAAAGAGAALYGRSGGEKPAEAQAKTAAPVQPKPASKADKAELKSVAKEGKVETQMSDALKLTEPADVGAALRAADKETPDSKLPADVRKDFAAKRSALEQRTRDAERMYMEALAQGKDDRRRRDMLVAVASVMERLGLALTSYFAAKQGMAMGANVAGNLKLQPTDANAAFDRSLAEYDGLVKEQKGLFDFRTRGVEREEDQLGRQEEKFEAGEVRKAERAEDAAARVAKEAEDKRQFEEGLRFRKEEGEAERASRERIAAMGSESRLEAANIRAAAQAARVSLNQAREVAKEDRTKADAYKKLEGAMAVLKGKPSDKAALRTFTESATVLGIPADEQDEIITAASGKGLFNFQDVEKARGLTSKYAPAQGQTQPPAGGAGAPASGMVRLRHPQTGAVHEMTEAEAAEARKYGYTDVR